MNRRIFLQQLSAWFAALAFWRTVKPIDAGYTIVNVSSGGGTVTWPDKLLIADELYANEFIVDEERVLPGGITVTSPSADYWDQLIVRVRMDANGYHVYRNGETFTLTDEGFVSG